VWTPAQPDDPHFVLAFCGFFSVVFVIEYFGIYFLCNAAIRMVVTLVAIVFPVVLVVSWVFELTPEGLRLEKMWRWPPCQRRARLPGRAGFGPGFL